MKDYLTPLAVALAAAAVAAPVPASAGTYIVPSKTGTGRVVMLEPLAFVKADDLNFGTYLIPSTGSGTVKLNPIDAGLTFTGTVTAMPTSAPTRGWFIGSGGPGQDVLLTASLPSKLYVDGDPANASIDVALKLNHVADSGGNYTYTINSAKIFNVYVGGDITIAAGQQPGLYSNTYSVTASYQ